MNQKPPEQSMKDDVIKAIESRQVKMRPKWQFITRAVLLLVGIVLGAIITLFISSFIVFVLRQTGVWFLPSFGLQNLGVFFTSLPWILLAVAVVFIFLLDIFIKKYPFFYTRPLIYSVLGIVVIVIVGSVAIGCSTFHKNLLAWTETDHITFGSHMYQHFMQSPDNVTVGTITEITSTGCKILGPQDQLFAVTFSPQISMPPKNNFIIGDSIVILGQRQGETIQAKEIEKLNPD